MNFNIDSVYSIDTDERGTTVMVTRDENIITLSAEASMQLLDHLLHSFKVHVTLDSVGRNKVTTRIEVSK